MTAANDQEAAIDLLNATPTDDIYLLADDPRMTLFLASGILRYTRTPRCHVRRELIMSSAKPEDAAYWQALADRVMTGHAAGSYCPNGVCPDDPSIPKRKNA